jgi:uncharacterized protein YndB with AHSA1/START domain
MKPLLCIAMLAALAGSASAGVADVTANGFTIELQQPVAAPPGKVYAALIEPSRWWSSDHTYSGDAANLSLDARATGCFCEKLADGGSVQHLTVLAAMPGKSLRLGGMLGPFQAVAGGGVMTWTLSPTPAGTDLKLTYQITGYDGLKLGGKGSDFWSKAADGMLSDQFVRLKRFVETGKAN